MTVYLIMNRGRETRVMGLFVREKLIYKERGKKEEWKRAQALLKEAG